MGFNMVRKLTKIESERWYYWTDKLGLLVWQDFPSISNMAKIEREDKGELCQGNTPLQWMEQQGITPASFSGLSQ